MDVADVIMDASSEDIKNNIDVRIRQFIEQVSLFSSKHETEVVDVIKIESSRIKSLGVTLLEEVSKYEQEAQLDVFNKQRLLDAVRGDLTDAKAKAYKTKENRKAVESTIKLLTSISSNLTSRTEYAEGGH